MDWEGGVISRVRIIGAALFRPIQTSLYSYLHLIMPFKGYNFGSEIYVFTLCLEDLGDMILARDVGKKKPH